MNEHHEWYAEKLRAEAAIDRLRAELAVKDEVALGIMAALVERNDAIARVRELADNPDGPPLLHYEDVLRALDGDTEEAAITYGYVRSWHVIEEGPC